MEGLTQDPELTRYWSDPELLASPLLVLWLDRHGPDALQWDPETIARTLQDESRQPVPALVVDRLLAAISIVTTDRFYTNLYDFLDLVNILAGTPAAGLFDPAEVDECAWAITEALLLEPPDNPQQPFHPDILRYLEVRLRYEGFLTVPVPLRLPGLDLERLAQPLLEQSGDDAREILQAAEERRLAVDRQVHEHLNLLFHQLEELPLQQGDAHLRQKLKV